MSDVLKVSMGIDFSLIGTNLRAMYEKNGEDYAILLAPTEQTANEGVSIGELIRDIKSMTKEVTGDDNVDTTQLEQAMTSAAAEGAGTGGDGTKMNLNSIRIRLQMAYLYIRKTAGGAAAAGTADAAGTEAAAETAGASQAPGAASAGTSEIEYAFQLQVLTEGLVPQNIKKIVDVKSLSLAVWNTDRRKILDQMSLMTVAEYLGLPEQAAVAAQAQPK